MVLKGDIHRTWVKSSASGDPKFSVPACAISLIFVLFERACQNARIDRVLFLSSYFLRKKKNSLFEGLKKIPKNRC